MSLERASLASQVRRTLAQMAAGAPLYRETHIEQRVWIGGHKRLALSVFMEMKNRGLIERVADVRADAGGYERYTLSDLGRQTAEKESP